MRVGIVGATGFVGGEMLRLLLGHPEVQVTVAMSRQGEGQRVDALFPALGGQTDLTLVPLDPAALAAQCDCAVLAVPHTVAMSVVPGLLDAGLSVVDWSGDFRLKDAAEYERWYGAVHTAPELLGRAVYGLPELHRAALQEADLVAVAGCYPTAALLGLAPLVRAELLEADTIAIVAMSGVTGAGASLTPMTHYSSVAGTVRPYGLEGHRHVSEIEAELGLAAGRAVAVTFLPHVVPMDRGILCTMTAQAAPGATPEALQACLAEAYADAACVRVLHSGQAPEPGFVQGSNRCDVAVRWDERTGRVLVLSALDNLVKGAAGQAVQCLNVMQGWPEALGLPLSGLWP